MTSPSVLPIVTQSLAQRIIDAEAATMRSWLGAMRDLSGNPFDVTMQRFGDATAFVTRAIRAPLFNRVLGVNATDLESLDAIQHFCRAHGAGRSIDISPFHASPALLTQLARSGLYQASFGMVMYGLPEPTAAPPPANMEVEAVGLHTLEYFVDVYRHSFGTIYGDEVRVLNGLADWRLYYASLDGKPVAIGMLALHKGVGILAGGATLLGARGRGCHKALIRRRMCDAAATGCDLMVGFCEPGSWSQANMQRAALRVAYTKATWIEDEARQAR